MLTPCRLGYTLHVCMNVSLRLITNENSLTSLAEWRYGRQQV